jgi:ParB family chromosome partitioning protein
MSEVKKRSALAELGADRTASVSVIDPDKLVIVGLDTHHESADADQSGHWAWEQRAFNAPDEDMVTEAMEIGIQVPILVVRDGDHPIVFDGRQRVIAAREANRRLREAGREPIRVPFLIKRVDEGKATLIGVILNEHRIEDDVLTKASKAQSMLDMGLPVARVAASFRVDKQTIDAWVSLLSLHPDIKGRLRAGKIGITACARLATLSKDEQLEELEKLLASGDTSIAAVDVLVKQRRAKKNGAHVEAPYMLPKRSHLSRILYLREHDDPDAARIPDAFISAIRWILGEHAPRNTPGLTACMDYIAAKKEHEPKAADAAGGFDHSDKPEEPAPAKKLGRKKKVS